MIEMIHFPTASFDPSIVSWVSYYSTHSTNTWYCGVDLYHAPLSTDRRTVTVTCKDEVHAREWYNRILMARRAALLDAEKALP